MGLVIGAILGAGLHLGIQTPGLVMYRFRWSPILGLDTPGVRQVLRLMGPRVLTVIFVQVCFLVRDNLASRLAEGSVSVLTYGWMLQQVPETLIGTAIGTAMLPALAELAARDDVQRFQGAVDRATRVLIGLTLPIAAVLAAGIGPLLQTLFKFDPAETPILLWTTRAFLVGLVGHSLLEVAARSFYARQDARTPLIASGINMLAFIVLGILLFRPLGPAGIALSDALAWTGQASALLFILGRRLKKPVRPGGALARAVLAGLLGAGVTLAVQAVGAGLGPLVASVVAMGAGALAALPVILPEIKLLFRL